MNETWFLTGEPTVSGDQGPETHVSLPQRPVHQ